MTTRRGFTLVELLVIVTILVILAALLLPAFSLARRAADNAVCVTTLRNIGAAVQSYCNDNDGYLPGPCYQGLGWSMRYHPTGEILFSYFAGYFMGKTLKDGDEVRCPQILCPAYKRQIPESQWNFAYYAVYRMRDRSGNVVTMNGLQITPWGHPGTTTNNKPLTMVTLFAMTDPAKQWAFRDADYTSYGVYAGLPQLPVHGKYWNQLYFDWHVEPLLPANKND